MLSQIARAAVAAVIAATALTAVWYLPNPDWYSPAPQPTPTHAPCRPLPDPDDCVQLGWLDGAWRCITAEQAG
jgi:hypothetical protein